MIICRNFKDNVLFVAKKANFVFVKQLSAILFLIIFSLTTLVPSTIRDVGKIANLFEHYQEHQLTDANISFWAFIELHYGSDFQQHQKAHDHSKLPLKNTHSSLNVFVLLSELINSPLDMEIQSAMPQQKLLISSFNQHCVSRNLKDIWQPPRVI